jgi:hypothetical protein
MNSDRPDKSVPLTRNTDFETFTVNCRDLYQGYNLTRWYVETEQGTTIDINSSNFHTNIREGTIINIEHDESGGGGGGVV